ncbi:uncharacterized SAM-binding protein YcdF (DUF218 family) [Oikeobacillus pervagus]|uniref:Uncharacterized SAM-binding protein YcdF (DUF218 family) n=1 Tax=Oikeobacillus pervagus TaxID=1325931 RepID=A0AAJ1T2K6_9BACI|nr:YdcF family protein [Oikeobacillus pervagus]MDQ0215531.1 uncharacterized SAM-binding protein YcdF (DUF218 family) [Oikeobacillus pervagus]
MDGVEVKKKMSLYAMLFILVSIGGFVFLHSQMKNVAKESPPNEVPYMIVLGAKVNGEEMSLSLRERAKTALEYSKKNPSTMLILSGGQGDGEDITEAEALRRFFLENGVEQERLLLETNSTSTYENLKFTKELYQVEEAVIVSNDFHLYRSVKLAEKLGIKAYPLSAKTPKVVQFQLYVREYFAILKMYLLGK